MPKNCAKYLIDKTELSKMFDLNSITDKVSVLSATVMDIVIYSHEHKTREGFKFNSYNSLIVLKRL